MDVGIRVQIKPIPLVPEHTTIFEAGSVSFHLEYRTLDRATLDAHIAAQNLTPEQMGVQLGMGDFDASGVSIHVLGQDGHEYLRFDCLDRSPHYHYIYPDRPYQRVVACDTLANGEPLPWALSCLRHHLVPMLREAGGAASAEGVDQGLVGAALDRLEHAANAALEAQRAQLRESARRTPAHAAGAH